MKRLYVFRHSIADSNFRFDKERKLTHQGVRYFKEQVVNNREILEKLDLVVVSDAVRTTETAEILLKELPSTNVVYSSALYNSDMTTLLNEIEGFDPDLNSIGLIAHNPGVSNLVSYLVEDGVRFQPGNFAIINYAIDSWKEVSNGNYSDWSFFS